MMGIRGLELRGDLRRRWLSTVGIALLVAVAAGAVLGSVAAAQRTSTAFDRMIADTDAIDIQINPDAGNESALTFEEVAALPGVHRAGRLDALFYLPPGHPTAQDLDTSPAAFVTDGSYGYDFARSLVVSGRLADRSQPFEVTITDEYAKRSGLGVGDTIPIRAVTPTDMEQLFSGPGEAPIGDPDFGDAVVLDIVGVTVAPQDVIIEGGFTPPEIMFTPAYAERYQNPYVGWWGMGVQLDRGADLAAFEDAVQATVPNEAIAFATRTATASKIERTVQPFRAALLAFALIASILGVIVIVQAVSRRCRQSASDQPVLQALGRTHGERFWSAMACVAIPVVTGSVFGMLIAWLVSPIAPVGTMRLAEPHPGMAFAAPVLIGGAVLFAAAVLLLSIIPVRRATRITATTSRRRPSLLATWFASTNAPISMSTGLRFAIEDAGTGVSARGALVGAATAVMLAVALLVFGASLGHFVDTPRLYGTDWNVKVDGNLDEDLAADEVRSIVDAASRSAAVEAVAVIHVSEVDIADERVTAVSLDDSEAPVASTVTEGRAPTGADEIALGRATADRLDAHLGDVLEARDASGTIHPLTVVGTVVLPEVGTYGGSDKTSLGDGALLSSDGFTMVAESFDKYYAVARVAGPDPVGTMRTLLPTFEDDQWVDAFPSPTPAEVQNLTDLRRTPLLLLGLLVVLVVSVVVHVLLVAFRARRKDLSVLQTLGLRPRQVVGTSLWQATITAFVAVVIGVPLGLVVGRWAWRLLASGLAVPAEPITPLVGTVVVAGVVILLANAIGLIPGWRASRRRPAHVLRSE